MHGDDGLGSSLAAALPHNIPHPRLRHASTSISYASSSTSSSASAGSLGSDASSSQGSSIHDDLFDCPSSVSSQSSVGSVGSAASGICLSQQRVEAKLAAARSWQAQQQQRQQLQVQQLQLQVLQQQQQQLQQSHVAPVPAPLRQHPRRSSVAPAVVPSLLRQSDRRTMFVDHLVDASTQIVQAIWPLSSAIGRGDGGSGCSGSGAGPNAGASSGSYLLPLRTFIQETLRRSRASYSTLQVALYYLLLIKPRLPSQNFTMEQSHDSHACRALQCGRRMFLAALILASKYLQDRNYSARAWSKISGLSTAEITQNEAAFLHAVGWRLHVTNDVYHRWIECVNKFNAPSPHLPPSPGPTLSVAGCAGAAETAFERKCYEFRLLIKKLSPSLDNLDELCSGLSAASPTAAGVAPAASAASAHASALARRSSFCAAMASAGALSPVSLCSSPGGVSSAAGSPASSNESTPLASSLAAAGGAARGAALGARGGALGLLPTPKIAPPPPGIFNCGLSAGPLSGSSGSSGSAGSASAIGSAAQMIPGSRSSMCFAVAQASNACATQFLDRWPCALSASSVSSASSASSASSSAASTASMSPGTGCVLTRRSSLANSVSTASSPESMISDSSLVSRSSSVVSSSAWLLMNAPPGAPPFASSAGKLDALQARHRFSKQSCSGSGLRDKCFASSLRPTLIPAVVPEGCVMDCGNSGNGSNGSNGGAAGDFGSSVFASPETTYTGPVGSDDVSSASRACGPSATTAAASVSTTRSVRRCTSTEMADATDAARALAELQQQHCGPAAAMGAMGAECKPRAGLKRSRPLSVDTSCLQDSVRGLLRSSLPKTAPEAANMTPATATATCGLEAMVLGQPATSQWPVNPACLGLADAQSGSRAASLTGSRKRLCRTMAAGAGTVPMPTTATTTTATTAATAFPYGMDLQHPSMSGLCGPGMWQGILN